VPICQVHQRTLLEGEFPIASGGLVTTGVPTQEQQDEKKAAADERNALLLAANSHFPWARSEINFGCIPPQVVRIVDSTSYSRCLYCPDCNDAKARWLQDRSATHHVR